MNFDEYQESCARTMNCSLTEGEQLSNWCMGLAGEVGEVIEPIKKYLFHGKEIVYEDITKELGDVLWYLTALCESLGISLENVAYKNISKLRARYPEKFVPGGGIRNEG